MYRLFQQTWGVAPGYGDYKAFGKTTNEKCATSKRASEESRSCTQFFLGFIWVISTQTAHLLVEAN